MEKTDWWTVMTVLVDVCPIISHSIPPGMSPRTVCVKIFDCFWYRCSLSQDVLGKWPQNGCCCLCECSFQHRCDETFSTEPVKNSRPSLSFQHVQQVGNLRVPSPVNYRSCYSAFGFCRHLTNLLVVCWTRNWVGIPSASAWCLSNSALHPYVGCKWNEMK